ncbi:hypothetical protein E5163_05000 [Marinicauda algicola]|uniref:Zinc finger/thioredoxin putative domain-containing protein n=1 Tax=Marinicauda algicola TaxID=2029849 RepID=A0A4V3RYI0_9PROT|nr:zinc-ribbon domain-containing protein [Marinicauda algicola]TGY90479.1 hypothetical protein E5163_05000 [Marinicauda algicola]
MIVTCPSCDAKYRAEPEALARRHGRVRCAGCGHVWTVEDEALVLEQPAEAKPASEPEEPKKPHEVIRQRAEQRRKTARVATEGAGWAGVAALFLVVLAGAWLFRVDVVQTFPRAANVYASVGVPVNPHGLEVADLAVERTQENGVPAIAIEGDVVNITGRVRETVPLRAALLDADGAILVEWTVLLESPELAGGALERFRTVLPDPPEGGAEVLVELAPGASAEPIAGGE